MLHQAGFTEVEFVGGLIEQDPLSGRRKLVAVARAAPVRRRRASAG
jgi:hypothetical protein